MVKDDNIQAMVKKAWAMHAEAVEAYDRAVRLLRMAEAGVDAAHAQRNELRIVATRLEQAAALVPEFDANRGVDYWATGEQ